MPTGYTSDLYEGTPVDFVDFALGCARAFGALVLMRDDPPGSPIPDEFKPSDYHVNALAEARARLAEAKGWSLREADARSASECERMAEIRAADMEKRAAIRERYEAMLAEVEAWEPPTADHAGMKDFMRSQLLESIKFDCSITWPAPERLTGGEYRAKEIAKAERDIVYHTERMAEEEERARDRTAWVQALKGSLGLTPVVT